MSRPGDDAPIFVVGNARSGTTLMRLMLSAHPRIYVCQELSFYQWASQCPAGLDGRTFLRHYFRTRSFKGARLDPSAVLADLPDPLARQNIGLALREIMRLKSAALGRVRYGDKSPENTAHLERIYADFPDARVVVMVRDPRTCVASMSRWHFASSSDLANCVTYAAARRRAWRFRDRARFVRLEDLQREPRRTMREVLDFVGEDWSEAVLDHAENRADQLDVPDRPWFGRAVTPLEQTAGQPLTLSPERIRLIETMTRQSMTVLGYKRLELERPPSGWRTLLRIASEVPATLRFWWAVIQVGRWLRDPAHWEPDDAHLATLVRRVNPSADQAVALRSEEIRSPG